MNEAEECIYIDHKRKKVRNTLTALFNTKTPAKKQNIDSLEYILKALSHGELTITIYLSQLSGCIEFSIVVAIALFEH